MIFLLGSIGGDPGHYLPHATADNAFSLGSQCNNNKGVQRRPVYDSAHDDGKHNRFEYAGHH